MKYANKRIGIAALALFLLGATNAFAEEFLVGAELPLSGSLARIGGGMSEGISVAVEVFNKTNGKHKIKLITIDDESAPAKAVAAVDKLAGQGVVAITGGYGSNNIAPASDAANKLGLPYITSGGVDDSLDGRLDEGVVDCYFEFELGEQADAELGAAIDLGVAALPATAAHVAHRHEVDVVLLQRFLDRFELLGADDGDDHFHERSFRRCRLAASLRRARTVESALA